jgi:hypothetical protein
MAMAQENAGHGDTLSLDRLQECGRELGSGCQHHEAPRFSCIWWPDGEALIELDPGWFRPTAKLERLPKEFCLPPVSWPKPKDGYLGMWATLPW